MDAFITLLHNSPAFLYLITGLLGLCVGSFLNVVIYRLPLIMEYEWRTDAEQYLNQSQGDAISQETAPDDSKKEKFNLSFPRSHCPKCQHQLQWFENIPLISWILQKGKCRNCHAPVSLRYPVVELITALLSMLVVWQFGPTLTSIAALGLVWSLIALTGIDFDTQLLPDRITLPLAAAGLLANSQSLFISPTQSIYGYVVGFLCLWVVYYAYKLLTGKEGMGYGDFKLLAALGAWLGPTQLPLIVLLSSLIGSIIGVILMRIKGKSIPFAFGPYIAIAGMISLLWGPQIMQWYLGLSKVSA